MALQYRFNVFTGNLDLVGTSGSGGGSNESIEVLTPTQVGDDVTLDLTELDHPYTVINGVFKNGQLLTPNDPSFGWTKTGDIITVLNGFDTDSYQVDYSYA